MVSVIVGMVLGRPPNTQHIADSGMGHRSPFASIGGPDRIGPCLIRALVDAVFAVGTGEGVVGVVVVLLVVTRGVGMVERSEFRVSGEAASETLALAVVFTPGRVGGILWAPVNTVGPGMGFDRVEEGHRGNQGGYQSNGCQVHFFEGEGEVGRGREEKTIGIFFHKKK